MTREKMYVEYPIAESLEQAIDWMKSENECWQEDTNSWPDCGGFDDIECLQENFPDGLDKSNNVHLVTKTPEISPPFKVGDEVVALEELSYCCGQDEDNHIEKHLVITINRIEEDTDGQQRLFFKEHADRYGPWKVDNFVLNICGD